MKLNHMIIRKLRDFRKESGSFSVEAVLMFPLLVWAFIAMFVFFEGLRESNINLKATYTISDLLSRETELIDQTFVDGMSNVYSWLTRSRNDVELRVTVVRYDQSEDKHIMVCSLAAGTATLTQGEVETTVSPYVPIMADADTAIVVEAWTTYTPILEIGLVESEIHNLVVTSPRFADKMDCAGVGDGGGSVHDDGTGGEDESI